MAYAAKYNIYSLVTALSNAKRAEEAITRLTEQFVGECKRIAGNFGFDFSIGVEGDEKNVPKGRHIRVWPLTGAIELYGIDAAQQGKLQTALRGSVKSCQPLGKNGLRVLVATGTEIRAFDAAMGGLFKSTATYQAAPVHAIGYRIHAIQEQQGRKARHMEAADAVREMFFQRCTAIERVFGGKCEVLDSKEAYDAALDAPAPAGQALHIRACSETGDMRLFYPQDDAGNIAAFDDALRTACVQHKNDEAQRTLDVTVTGDTIDRFEELLRVMRKVPAEGAGDKGEKRSPFKKRFQSSAAKRHL